MNTLDQLVTDYTAYAKTSENAFLIRVALELRNLAKENADLQNKLWSTQHTQHMNDPWEEREDG